MSWQKRIGLSDTESGGPVTAPSMNVTRIATFFAGLFAGLTQLLTAIDTITLTAGQMVLIWLVVGGFIVFLFAVDMLSRAYVTARQPIPRETPLAELHLPHVDVQTTDDPHSPRMDAELVGVYADTPPIAHVKIGGAADALVPLNRVHQKA